MQTPIKHGEMVGADEISSAAFLYPAGDHSDSLSSLYLQPYASTALIDINNTCYEPYWWLTQASRNAAPLEGKRRSDLQLNLPYYRKVGAGKCCLERHVALQG